MTFCLDNEADARIEERDAAATSTSSARCFEDVINVTSRSSATRAAAVRAGHEKAS